MQQQDIITQIEASLQTTFGANINFGPESVMGQIVGIFSEREALIWQLAEAVYNSQYPAGAEGTSVDNILALNNLTRLPATATVTDPTPLIQSTGITLFGLVLYGTSGTSIPSGSIIQTSATPPLSFTLDNTVAIASAQNAIQSVFFSNTPNIGTFTISIQDTAGTTLTTSAIEFDALASQTSLTFTTLPVASSGFTLSLTRAGATLTTGNIVTNSAFPTSAAIQTAIRALTGYSATTVAGSAGSYTIQWFVANPVVTVATNTTLSTITPTDSVQALFDNLHDTSVPNYPYTDVTVTGSFASGFIFTFGGEGSPIGSNPVSGNKPQALMTAVTSGLQSGATVTNINIITTNTGTPAQAVGTATCTTTGPNFVKAGTLTVIGSPVSGWTSVTNQLDCISGTNLETDTSALERRSALLAAQANGPIQSIVEKVSEVPQVTAVIGFQNLTGAAQQTVTFGTVPTSGTWNYTVGGQTITGLAFNVTAAQFQAALQALVGFGTAQITGNVQFGFTIDFNGSNGGQAVGIATIFNGTNATGIIPNFGRPPNSFEILVNGGSDGAIAQTIYDTSPAGILSYSAPVLVTQGTTTGSSTTLTALASTTGVQVGQSIFGEGIQPGTTVVNVSSSTIVVMSLPALTSNTATPILFNHTVTITDAFGNPVRIGFSRPVEIPIYVSISLTTDTYLVPGNTGSGLNANAKFNPQSIGNIQTDIIAIGNEVPIGGTIIGFGTNGLIGAFNSVPGIVNYTLYFDVTADPFNQMNISLQPEQLAVFESFNISVSYV